LGDDGNETGFFHPLVFLCLRLVRRLHENCACEITCNNLHRDGAGGMGRKQCAESASRDLWLCYAV